MILWRQQELDEWSNGFIRSVCKIPMFELESFTFSANVWHPRIALVTNIGVFVFDEMNQKLKPRFIGWPQFKISLSKDNMKIDLRMNLLTFNHLEEEEVQYSCATKDMRTKFAFKVKLMLKEYGSKKPILVGNQERDE